MEDSSDNQFIPLCFIYRQVSKFNVQFQRSINEFFEDSGGGGPDGFGQAVSSRTATVDLTVTETDSKGKQIIK